MVLKNDDANSDEDRSSPAFPKRMSRLRNEVIIASSSSEDLESECSSEMIPVEENNENTDHKDIENSQMTDLAPDGIKLIKDRLNDGLERSNSCSVSRPKRLDSLMVHTNSEGQFGKPLKTVFFPENGSILPKSPSNGSNADRSIPTISISKYSESKPPSPAPTYVPTSANAPAPVMKQASRPNIEEKLSTGLKETDPLFDQPKKRINILQIIRESIRSTIPESSKPFRFWNFFINVMHLFNLVVAPVLLGWYTNFISLGWILVFLCLDVLFLVDCYLKAHATFIDEYGIVISDPDITTKRYIITNWGWMDVISSLPFDLLAFSTSWDIRSFSIWAILRFVKLLFRFPYVGVFDAQVPKVALPISRLIKTMVVLLFLGHLDGCLFWFMEAYLSPPRWIDKEHLADAEFSTQYLVSYISALKSLVLKLRSAYKDGENIYVVFEFIAGILAYGTVFGNIHSIVEMMDDTVISNQAEERHKFEMDRLRQYMREKGIIPELQKMVNSHKELQWMRSQGVDESKLFDDLPKSLQQEIKNFLYLDLVKKVPLFQDTDIQFQYSVSLKIKPIHIIEGCYIFRKDDEGQEMFFIKSGQVEIVGDTGQIFVTLGTGSFFGEIALFKNCKRTASARAKGNVELCMLTKDDYNFILSQFPIISERIQRTIKEREENEARKKAEQAALDAAKKLEEERESQAKLEKESRQKSTLFGSIASLASSIMSREHSIKIVSKPDLHSPSPVLRGQSLKNAPTNKSLLNPGRQSRASSFSKSLTDNH